MTVVLKEKAVNRLDNMMTPGQVARRKFKSSLPRKVSNRTPSPMEALGETFTLLDRFRTMVAEEGADPDRTLYAALAYYLPEASPETLAFTAFLPGPSKAGEFCDDVMKLPHPVFLGLVFIQVDLDTENPAYRTVSFCTQFMGGPDAEARLLYAQRMLRTGLQKMIDGLRAITRA
jgi:hypothetical protein